MSAGKEVAETETRFSLQFFSAELLHSGRTSMESLSARRRNLLGPFTGDLLILGLRSFTSRAASPEQILSLMQGFTLDRHPIMPFFGGWQQAWRGVAQEHLAVGASAWFGRRAQDRDHRVRNGTNCCWSCRKNPAGVSSAPGWWDVPAEEREA